MLNLTLDEVQLHAAATEGAVDYHITDWMIGFTLTYCFLCNTWLIV